MAVRTNRTNTLFGHDRHGELQRDEVFNTYGAAVIAGQKRFGRGHFLVDTGDRVPTRSEQLLKAKKNERQERLDLL